MGLRAMVSPNRGQGPQCPPPFVRQGSVPNLTLDEVPSHLSELGKPLNAMNLNELLNSVMAVEQHIHAPSSSLSSASTAQPLSENYNMNCPLIHKTLDEIWQEVIQLEGQGNTESPATFGETTLKDILALFSVDPEQQEDWLQYQLAAAQQQQQQHQHMALLGSGLSVLGNAISNAGFSEIQQMGLPMVSMAMTRTTSSDSHTPTETHRPDEIVDKNIERRQKRMIKNRESAARSRARKQAYINQLEEEVRQLTNTNKRLKKQKEGDMLLHLSTPSVPRYQLRRTSSAPF
uniref:ABSCISIC ACID-INSENSITIVE 5-like protein 2 n=1 Tax=Elaeis guineensis var. tenera TaxID=51953 RepID=A0A8N4F2A5_ELAGV|nr:ABSCISIC ACID-INSENSITIVE 5-like protein 2 [Elaeis guineensis]